jgi:hypothetical protein
MREFPHLVQLHEKEAKKGVVTISVSIDKKKDHDKALNFLKESDANFANYRIDDEDNETIYKRWDFEGPPQLRVYDRDGKLQGTFDDYEKGAIPEVNKLLKEEK